jgi:hypothetical protein
MAEFLKIPVEMGVPNPIFDYVGTGSPVSALPNAAPGSLYRQKDGGAGSIIWQKNSSSWEALTSNGFTQTVADGLYSPLGHTHTFASLTSKPTTVAGYGITDPIAYLNGGQTFTVRTNFYGSTGDFSYNGAGVQLREYALNTTATEYGPRLAFHWGGVVASQIGLEWAGHGGITTGVTGRVAILSNPGTGYERLIASSYDFSSGPRLTDATSSYAGLLGGTAVTGMRFMLGNGNTKGYVYGDTSGFGLLNDTGNYSVLCTAGAGLGGQLIGSWTATVNLLPQGELRAGAYAGGGHTAGDITARRSATTGVYYFGDYTDRYLYYDGSVFNLSGGVLSVPSGVSASDFTLA